LKNKNSGKKGGHPLNILILSAGTRDKVVQYFKKEIGNNGKIIATDCSNLAPAVYDADAFYLVPRITTPGYLDVILDICRKQKITGVFSLIDPELSLLAKEREKFLAVGATPIISDYDLVETCFDKYRMFELLKRMNIPTGKCYMDKEKFYQAAEQGEISYPVFVKPVRGSASIHINKVNSAKEVEVLFDLYDDLMIQEYMDGQEYGADVYIDMLSGKCTDIFVKKKIKMRAGETDKSVSYKNEALFSMIKNFVEECGFRGMIDIDIFDIGGTWYISEVNPRFGGGYPHAYACGVNMPAALLRNLAGEENEVRIGNYRENISMMKYNEIAIRDMNGVEIVP
jgi:carbamoyl-phosphate synthase large subunit